MNVNNELNKPMKSHLLMTFPLEYSLFLLWYNKNN